jgi:hypothetical protein
VEILDGIIQNDEKISSCVVIEEAALIDVALIDDTLSVELTTRVFVLIVLPVILTKLIGPVALMVDAFRVEFTVIVFAVIVLPVIVTKLIGPVALIVDAFRVEFTVIVFAVIVLPVIVTKLIGPVALIVDTFRVELTVKKLIVSLFTTRLLTLSKLTFASEAKIKPVLMLLTKVEP